MGLFDSLGDLSVSGDYSNVQLDNTTPEPVFDTPDYTYNPQQPEFQQRMFGDISTDPAGVTDTANRANSSFWDFDQSKISASLSDVLNSGMLAGQKLLLQQASDSINANASNNNPWVAGFFNNFRSTKTGAQINAGAYATQFQNFLANPIVWFVGAGLLLFLFLRK